VALSLCLTPFLGRNFFPDAESNQIRMHVRAQMGTRIEETGALAIASRQNPRDLPKGSLASIVDNIGLPISGTNMSYNNSAHRHDRRRSDADLRSRPRANSDPMMAILREQLRANFPA